MADSLVYLYAVGDAALDEAVAPGLTGVAGAPVRVIVDGRLAAVVSTVDPLHFSEEALQRNLEDLTWLAATARAHHTVVDAVWQRGPVAPLRLETVYLDDDNVRAVLRAKEAAFTGALDRIRGAREWGVKAFARSQPDADPDELTRQALGQFLERNQIKGDLICIGVAGQAGLARFRFACALALICLFLLSLVAISRRDAGAITR